MKSISLEVLAAHGGWPREDVRVLCVALGILAEGAETVAASDLRGTLGYLPEGHQKVWRGLVEEDAGPPVKKKRAKSEKQPRAKSVKNQLGVQIEEQNTQIHEARVALRRARGKYYAALRQHESADSVFGDARKAMRAAAALLRSLSLEDDEKAYKEAEKVFTEADIRYKRQLLEARKTELLGPVYQRFVRCDRSLKSAVQELYRLNKDREKEEEQAAVGE